MISKDKALKLVKIYCYICHLYEQELQYSVMRFSNNNQPGFTDQEAMCIYLFSIEEERRFQKLEIYLFAKNYLSSWFPQLPSYQTFCDRINRLGEAFRTLCEHLFENFIPEDCHPDFKQADSYPIMTCSHKRTPKVATEIIDKGYCATKDLHYYGVKLHALTRYRKGTLPFPERIDLTAASVNDMKLFKSIAPELSSCVVFADKMYADQCWEQTWREKQLAVITPIKNVKGETAEQRHREKAYRDLYSKAVSTIRQPIESLFNWINEKTDIQNAGKVRSTKGLLATIFGKITAAFISIIL